MNARNAVALGEVCQIIAGQHIEASLYTNTPCGTPYLTGPADFGDISPIITKWTKHPKVFALDTDILITVKGAGVGKSNLGCNAAIGRQLMALRSHSDALDRAYLFQYIRSKDRFISALAQGATVPGIVKEDLADLRIPLPPLSEQRRIADVLDRAEALRAKRRAALAELDGLADAIFVDLFGDTVKNPRHWATVQIRDIGDIQGGLQVTTTRSMLQLEIPYLRVANVYRDRIDLTEVKSIRATESEVARTNLAFHDLLIVEGHGNPHEIGRCGLWTNEVSPCVHQNHIIRVRVDNKRVDPVFSWRYLNSTGGRRDLLRAAKTTSGLNTISVSNVKDASLWLPPLALQQEFARRVAAVERLKAVQRASLAELDALFASLQDRAFRGAL